MRAKGSRKDIRLRRSGDGWKIDELDFSDVR